MHIGLYFGSFNPIHNGHLAVAGYMAQFTALNQVWLVVSPQNPLKEKQSLLKDHHRYAMVQRALESYSYLRVSDIEFHLPVPSFTINTLVALQEKYPQHQFSLIMGSDNLQSLHKWKNFDAILEHHHIFVYPRKGSDGGQFRNHPHVIWVADAPEVEISSTFIREAIKNKKSAQFLMPPEAWQYAEEMHFYK